MTALPPSSEAASGRFTHRSVAAAPDGTSPARDYWLYVPRRLAPARQRAIVTFLHGCAQTGDEAARGAGWNELADRFGFVVAYPEQHVPSSPEADGSPGGCWNAGQAAAFPRGQGELESVARITRTVAKTYRANPRRSFLIGISSGALMGSSMAATYPDLYTAFASIAGCGYMCVDATGDLAYRRMGRYERRMPVFTVTGTLDYLTNVAMGELTVLQWLGTNDLADDGEHNLSVPIEPSSVEHRYTDRIGNVDPSGDLCVTEPPRNPCPLGALGISPYPTTVRTFDDAAGKLLIEAWLVHGLSHNYSGGSMAGTFTDPYGPNVTAAAWRFFMSQ